MPPIRPLSPFWLAPLLALLAVEARADGEVNYNRLGWATRAQIAEMPEAMRPTVAPTCSGAWVTPIPASVKIGDPNTSEINASAEDAHYDPKGVSELRGNVHIRQQGREIDADNAEIIQEEGKGTFSGNIRIAEPGLVMTGEKAFYNFSTQEARIEHTEFVASLINGHGRADSIQRREEGVVTIARGEYSTCEPDNRSWFFEARDIKLNQNTGRGTVRNATLHVKDVPVLYVPYFNFPIDDRRQTGVLVPRFGTTNDGGFDFALPVYLNLAPNYDATITPRLITRRGLMGEGEFRYLLPWGGSGSLQGAYLPGDRLFGDQDRKSGSWKHTGQLSERLSVATNLNYVSDNAYFTDLGTDLNLANTTHQERSGELLYRADSWSLLSRVQGFQTIDPLILDKDKPYARLPQLLLNAGKLKPRGWQPTVMTELTSFQRGIEDGSGLEINGGRYRLEPSLQYAVNEPWGFVRPTAKVRHVSYELTGDGVGPDEKPSATVPVLSLDSGLVFERDTGRYVQTLEPRAYYLYSPYAQQADLPNFDTVQSTFNYSQLFRDSRFSGGDRLDDANQLSLGLTSRLVDPDTGNEQLRASLGQIFYFRDRKVNLLATDPVVTTGTSGVAAELASQFNEGWGGIANALWSPNGEHASQFSVDLNYLPPERDRLFNAGYNFRREDPSLNQKAVRQTQLSFVQPVHLNWTLLGLWQYDLRERESQDALLGVQYESCCYVVRLFNRQFLSDPDNLSAGAERRRTAFFIEVQLKGLAGFGSSVDSLLGNNVYGYTQLLHREDSR